MEDAYNLMRGSFLKIKVLCHFITCMVVFTCYTAEILSNHPKNANEWMFSAKAIITKEETQVNLTSMGFTVSGNGYRSDVKHDRCNSQNFNGRNIKVDVDQDPPNTTRITVRFPPQ